MIPFLKKRNEGSASGPVETIEREPDDGAADFGTLDAVAEDMLMALQNGDAAMLKEALSSLVAHIQSADAEQDAAEVV